jgi:hypothetical protein
LVTGRVCGLDVQRLGGNPMSITFADWRAD